MRLALTILIVICAAGLLIHAWFNVLRPFDIMLQSIRLGTRLIMERPLLAATSLTVMLLLPLGSLVSGAIAVAAWQALLLLMVWQAICTSLLALVAVRIHRRVVVRDKSRWIRLGPIETRMVLTVLAVWGAISTVELLPVLMEPFVPRLAARGLQVASQLGSWCIAVLFVYAGPAASLQDARPFLRTVTSVRSAPSVAASLVILSRGLFALISIAVVTIISLIDTRAIIMIAAVVVLMTASVLVFFISEVAIAIALTRANENLYDDTRSRDYNADWH